MEHIKEESISAYMDDEIDDEEQKQIEKHLETCSHCQSIYQELKEMKHLIFFAYEQVEAPQTIEKQVMAQLNPIEMRVPEIMNKIPWMWVVLPLFIIAFLLTSHPLLVSLGIITSVFKVFFSIISAIVAIVPYLFGIVITVSLVGIVLSLWSLRRLMIRKAI